VALQAHRLRHGQFPDDVVTLLDGPLNSLPTTSGVDRRGSLFEFRRAGYPQPMVLGDRHVLPAGQPLLTVRSDIDFGRFATIASKSNADDQQQINADDVTISATSALQSSNLPADIARPLGKAYHEQFPTRIAFVEPRGTADVDSWFCPTVQNFKDGKYVETNE
ncbi:MAG: hypothetical protein ACK5Q5_09460, partial [Planctomycetaceae bacterium]